MADGVHIGFKSAAKDASNWKIKSLSKRRDSQHVLVRFKSVSRVKNEISLMNIQYEIYGEQIGPFVYNRRTHGKDTPMTG